MTRKRFKEKVLTLILGQEISSSISTLYHWKDEDLVQLNWWTQSKGLVLHSIYIVNKISLSKIFLSLGVYKNLCWNQTLVQLVTTENIKIARAQIVLAIYNDRQIDKKKTFDEFSKMFYLF